MLNKRYARRLEVMLAAAVCIFLILLGRMAYLQLYKGDYYGNQADGNRLRRTKITAPRGLFFDYKGQELVNNLPGYAVALQRQGQRDNEKVIGTLSEILKDNGCTIEDIKTKLQAVSLPELAQLIQL